MWTRRYLLPAVWLASSFGLAPDLPAQFQLGGSRARAHVTWKVSVEPKSVVQGGKIEVVASYDVAEDWHLYAPDFEGTGLATKLSVDSPLLEPDGAVKFPEPETKEVMIVEKEVHRLLSHQGAIRQSYVVKNAPVGVLDFKALLTYMTCSGNRCDPPKRNEPHALSLEVLAGDTAKPDDTAKAETEKPVITVGEDILPDDGKGEAPAAAKGGSAHVSWGIRVEPGKVRRGEKAHIVAEYEIGEGYYIYAPDHDPSEGGVPTAISANSPHVAVGGKPTFPEPTVKKLLGQPYRALLGKGAIRQAIVVKPEAPPGDVSLEIHVSYATCYDGGCFPPEEHEDEVTFTVSDEPPVKSEAPEGDTGAAPKGAPPDRPVSGGVRPEDIVDVSLWALVVLMVTGGLLALIMPCTYPMIPLTIAYFSNQAEARKGSVLPLALAYGAGIVLSFNIIGWAFAPFITSFAANPWFNLTVALLFLAFGLSLLGIFNLRLPAGLTALSSKASGATGYLGVFALGATLVIASFACTAPIMGPLLVVAAGGEVGGEPLSTVARLTRVTVGMTAFGATMAAPFVLLALFPARIRSLPRSGEWMQTVKVFLGFVLLAACLLFFSNAGVSVPREPFLVICAAIFAAAALYLLGVVRLKDEEAKGIGSFRLLVGVATLALALYVHLGATGFRLHWLVETFLPPSAEDGERESSKPRESDRLVFKDLDEGLKAAREKGIKALVNFSGFT